MLMTGRTSAFRPPLDSCFTGLDHAWALGRRKPWIIQADGSERMRRAVVGPPHRSVTCCLQTETTGSSPRERRCAAPCARSARWQGCRRAASRPSFFLGADARVAVRRSRRCPDATGRRSSTLRELAPEAVNSQVPSEVAVAHVVATESQADRQRARLVDVATRGVADADLRHVDDEALVPAVRVASRSRRRRAVGADGVEAGQVPEPELVQALADQEPLEVERARVLGSRGSGRSRSTSRNGRRRRHRCR